MVPKLIHSTGIFALILASAAALQAGTTVWAMNASLGNPHIQAYDLADGHLIVDFPAPNNDALRGRANGRGIAVVGDTIYYSLADSPNVYKTDATHRDLGSFKTQLSPGINSLSWDGTSLWMVASSPTNEGVPADDKLYQYSPSGQPLQILALAGTPNSNLARDGFEVLPDGRFIANHGGMPYDIYNSNGTMQKPLFITGTFRPMGIAFDGTNYIVSAPSFTDTGGGRLAIYDANGGSNPRFVDLPAALIPYGIVDLAVDRAAVPPPASAAPAIAAGQVQNGASYQEGIVPNSFMQIKGTNLASTTVDWTNFIGANGELPTSINNVSVSVGGKPAYIAAISPGQINVLAPDVGLGPVQVTVTTLAGTSAAVTANSQQYGPAFFPWGSYAVATRPDFSIAVKNGTFPAATVPAKPGDTIILWGTGFGPTTPAAPVGVKVPFGTLFLTSSPVTVTLGNTPVQVFGAAAALAAPYAGLYQVNIKIPDSMPDGDWPIVATINGVSSPATTLLTVLR